MLLWGGEPLQWGGFTGFISGRFKIRWPLPSKIGARMKSSTWVRRTPSRKANFGAEVTAAPFC